MITDSCLGDVGDIGSYIGFGVVVSDGTLVAVLMLVVVADRVVLGGGGVGGVRVGSTGECVDVDGRRGCECVGGFGWWCLRGGCTR